MVHTKIGSSLKLKRLSPAERWCYVAGVLAIAAESPTRGVLLLTATVPADHRDVAVVAGTSPVMAKKAMEKLRQLGMLEAADAFGAERVRDWDEWQVDPEKRTDPTAARRQQLHRDPELRDRIRLRDNDRCRYCGCEVKWADRRGPFGGTYDHVDPAGDNSETNLVVACRRCNSAKHCRTPEEAGMDLLPIQVGSKSELGLLSREVEEEGEGKEETPLSPPEGDDLGWSDWVGHHVSITAAVLPGPRTKAYKAMVALFRQRRQEGYSVEDLKLATIGAWNDEYRRQQGYYTPDSVLRPTKVHPLIEKGRRGSQPERHGQNVVQLSRACRDCGATVEAGYGAFCEECSERRAG